MPKVNPKKLEELIKAASLDAEQAEAMRTANGTEVPEPPRRQGAARMEPLALGDL